MFFRASRDKRIGDAVLKQVQPLLNVISRFLGEVPPGLASDKYVLGFFCANIGVEMRRAAGRKLPPVREGTILFLVLQQLFGKESIGSTALADLLSGIPAPDGDFNRGSEVALKIQAASSGNHRLQNDPDYVAAKQVALRLGNAHDFISPGATEDSKIAAEMMTSLYFQYVMDRYRGSPK